MTDNSYLLDGQDKKKVNWFGRILKIGFVIAAFALVMITVLANMGGKNETLKQGVIQFTSELFGGRPVSLDTLNNMSFFPRVGLDVEGLHVISKPENGAKIMSIGKLQAYMGFWQVATRKPQIKGFYLEDVYAIKGAFIPNEVTIEKIFIDHDLETGTANLRGNGKIGVHQWNFSAGMKVFGSKGKYSFALSGEFPVTVEIADIKFDTQFVSHEDNYFKLETFTLTQGEKKISGNIVLSALGKNLLKIKAKIDTQNESRINADLVADMSGVIDKYSGTITSEKLVLAEIIGEASAFTIFKRLRDIMGYTERYREENPMSILGPNNLDLDLDLKNVEIAQNQIIDVALPLKLENAHLKLGNILAIPLEKDIVTISENNDAQDLSFLHQWLPVIPAHKITQDCHIEKSGEDIKNVMLEKFSYEFVQGSLQAKSEKSKCAGRIEKIPEPEPETEKAEPEENAGQPTKPSK